MNRWLFTVEKLDALEEFCACGHLAQFLITVPPYPGAQSHKFCGPCAAAYMLQTLKYQGVEIAEVCAAFPKLSEAVDRPPLVM